MFPILGDPIVRAVPWAALTPHEARARRNHDQTLNQLAQRGGLSVVEAVLVLRDKPLFFTQLTATQLADYRTALMQDLKSFERVRTEQPKP